MASIASFANQAITESPKANALSDADLLLAALPWPFLLLLGAAWISALVAIVIEVKAERRA